MKNTKTLRMAGLMSVIVLLVGCQLADMAQFTYANATATHRWEGSETTTTVPFEWVDSHIVLPVSLNGSKPLRFVLDSGAAATVILESVNTRPLALELGAELPVSGVGNGQDPTARIVEDTEIALGGVSLKGLSAIYLPQSSVPFFDNLDEVYFDGVIGAPFFQRFMIEIDYDRQLIVLSEADTIDTWIARNGSDWQGLPIEIQSGVPFLTTQLRVENQRDVNVKLLLDTGYRGPVSLTPDTHVDIDKPRHYYSTVNQGLSGDVPTRVGMTESLLIGTYDLNSLPVSYSMSGGESDHGSNGLLGNEVLSHFNLLFDYANKRVFVKANTRYGTAINADKSGLLIRPHRLGAVVKSVARPPATGRAEPLEGDVITSMDGEATTYSSIAEQKQRLGSERDSVSACWLSGGEKKCGTLSLASRFARHEK